MDAGDLDGDGDADIILGAAYFPWAGKEVFKGKDKKPFLILRNSTR